MASSSTEAMADEYGKNDKPLNLLQTDTPFPEDAERATALVSGWQRINFANLRCPPNITALIVRFYLLAFRPIATDGDIFQIGRCCKKKMFVKMLFHDESKRA